MKDRTGFKITFYLFYFVIFYYILSFKGELKEIKNQMAILQEEVNTLKATVTILEERQNLMPEILSKILQNHSEIINENLPAEEIKNKPDEEFEVSRGIDRVSPIRMKVTAYDLSYESCKKYPNHPEYGITASGERVKEWYTVAAGPEIPFGTKIFIPYFKDKPNNGIFVVQDRGSAIKENCLDVYMKSYEDCMNFGVKYLDVYILD